MRGTYPVARGSRSGGRIPSARQSSCIAAVNRSVTASVASPCSFARAMILSSTSVTLRT